MDTLGSGLGSCDTIGSGVAKWVRVGLVHPIPQKAFRRQLYIIYAYAGYIILQYSQALKVAIRFQWQ